MSLFRTRDEDGRYAREREAMLHAIERDVRETAATTGRRHLDGRVVRAMTRVPRHEFVPADERDVAYANRALPIGHGQTISQPFIVALMTDLLSLGVGARVLEIGTGCGYQSAVLAEVASKVYSIEYVPELARDAAGRLRGLGYDNVEVRQGDGRRGWPEQAPFDGIIITAAASEVPDALKSQLAPGARLVAPLGPYRGAQMLTVLTRSEDGAWVEDPVLAVAFVPLVGED